MGDEIADGWVDWVDGLRDSQELSRDIDGGLGLCLSKTGQEGARLVELKIGLTCMELIKADPSRR